jgi:hypothetical protein
MQTETYLYGIVGFGIAGQLLLLELRTRGIQPTQIVLLDETFLGGALATHYGAVQSNTPWWKTRKALAEYPLYSQEALAEGDSKFPTEQCMPVRDIARLCLKTALEAARQVERFRTTVSKIEHDGSYRLTHTFGEVRCQTLFVCHGGQEKSLNLSIPTIPLSLAFDTHTLSQHVSPSDTVVVFGLSHSGVILCENLSVLGVQTTAVYNTPTPFEFERDGHYGGIKEGAIPIAEAILAGAKPHITLQTWNDPLALHKVLTKATKCIYAVGFTPRLLQGLSTEYDAQTAQLKNHPNCYGYGIAFPGTSEVNGKTYVDVSVLSFQEQIRKTLPKVLGTQ